jgi:hypothetical protein
VIGMTKTVRFCTLAAVLLIAALSFLFLIPNAVSTEAAVVPDKIDSIASPDGLLSFNVFADDNGRISYNIVHNGIEAVERSSLGILTGLYDFTGDLEYTGKSPVLSVDSEFHLVSGKNRIVSDVYNQTVFSFEKNGAEFAVEVKVYNDGAGFRYLLEGSTEDVVVRETTSIKIPESSIYWGMQYLGAQEEQFFDRHTVSQLGSKHDSYFMPFLYNVQDSDDGTYVLILQADVNSRYAGSRLYRSAERQLDIRFIIEQTEPVVIQLPFASPWRIFAIGTAGDIAETNIVECFAAETDMADTSWIKPGITAWTWYNNDRTDSLDVYKNYVDFAAEMGWSYVLLDEGWQPSDGSRNKFNRFYYEGEFEWVTNELIPYANDKNIGILVWSDYVDLTGDRIERLERWAEMGVKGVKVDFFDNETQAILYEMDRILDECARLRLIVNFHGAVAPTGVRRTQPHELAREGVQGEEYNKWPRPDGWPATTIVQNTILPFTRQIAGAMDFTPALSTHIKDPHRTQAHSAALTVLFECGTPTFADRPAVYRASAFYDFLRDIPAVWDEFKYLGGRPSEYAAVARRNGDDWYIAAITVDARSDFEVELDFLSGGTYYASIFTDGLTPSCTDIEYRQVQKDDTIKLPMALHGGAVVKLTKATPVMPVNLQLTPEAVQLGVGLSGSVAVHYDKDPMPSITRFNWESANPAVASVSNGVITGQSIGQTTVSMIGPNGIMGTVAVSVVESLPLTHPWRVVPRPSRPLAPIRPHIDTPASIFIKTQHGDMWNTWNNNGSNLNMHLMEVPGDTDSLTITAKLTFEPTFDFQMASLTFYIGDGNFVSVMRRHHSEYGGNAFMVTANYNSVSLEESINDAVPDTAGAVCYLKLVKEGSVFRGYYSEDNLNWVFISSKEHDVLDNASILNAGFYAANGGGDWALNTPSAIAVFEDFTLNNELVSFARMYNPGHVLGRGGVTVADASLAFRGVLGLTELTPSQRQAAAIDSGIGFPTIGDVLRIFRFALGLSTEL